MTPEPDPLTDIASALYAVPPDEFTGARNARAGEIADKALSAQVRSLRKPLLAAWVVNVLAREHADDLGEAFRLAEELRAAQEDLDAPTLSRLGRERRALVRELAKRAADLATERGERVTPATLESVQQTLNAAMLDAGASAAVASGRLIRPLDPSAMDPADLLDAVAGRVEAPTAAPAPQERGDELQARRARREAERAAREADREAAEAEHAQEELDARLAAARDRAVSLEEREETLRSALDRVREEAERVHAELEALSAEQAAVAKRVRTARRAVEDARAELED